MKSLRAGSSAGTTAAAILITLFAHPGSRLAAQTPEAQTPKQDESWLQWGGPHRNFLVHTSGLADQWPESGPRELWSQSLGAGHSAILYEENRLYTMYREGDNREPTGPWSSEETIAALDAATGATVWEYRYPSEIQDFGRGAGPHSTPLLAGNRLFAIGTNKKLHAINKNNGELVWSVDLVKDLGAPPLLVRPMVKSGYASSPIAYKDMVVSFVGGPGQSVVAFRQSDGAVVWKSGHFLISGASPVLIDVDGQTQMVFFAGSLIAGLDPDNGEVLWAHAHDAGNDFNLSQPLFGDDQTLFLSSAYRSGSRALRLALSGGTTRVEELWFDNRIKFQFLNAVRIDNTVYGTTGQSGTAFLSAVDITTGKEHWRHRGFGQSTLLHGNGKLIVLSEDGDLAIAKVSPEGIEVLAETKLFNTKSWAVPTLVGTTLYARDRERIMAIDLGSDP